MGTSRASLLLVLACSLLTKGDRPGKPENLSCRAEQEGSLISATIRCEWDPVGRQTTDVPTTYTLNVRVVSAQTYTVATDKNDATISMDIFPSHMTLEIWVEAQNKLGKIESDHLEKDAGWFVKTNPPSDVRVISENNFSTSLLINWTHPIAEEYVRLKYEIRFCPLGSQKWIYVPPADTDKYIQSFRLQNLQPDTVYVTQVRCKNARDGHGYWSDWSSNATKRTPEDRPTSKPDLWKNIAKDNHIKKLARAKEENLDMHQVLDQTLLELNNL